MTKAEYLKEMVAMLPNMAVGDAEKILKGLTPIECEYVVSQALRAIQRTNAEGQCHVQ